MTDTRTTSGSRIQALRPWFTLTLALVALGLAMWIVVPAPNRGLLPLGVGAPEISGLLVIHAFLAVVAAALDVRRRRVARYAMALAVTAFVLAASPLLRFPSTLAANQRALRAALGDDYLNAIPSAQLAGMRPRPLVLRDMFGSFRSDSVRLTRNLHVATVDGVRLTMDVYQPLDSDPHPILVQIYGGAWQRGTPADFPEFARYFASRGYIVFALDYRHAPQFRFPAQLDDVRMGLKWVFAHAGEYRADTTRVALVGRSAGAHLAMLAAWTPGAVPVRAVINFYGPVELVESYRHPPSPDPLHVRDVESKFLGGGPDSQPELYRLASPITYATRVLPPALLIYGGRDHIVEPRFGRMLAERLKASGTTVVHLEIPWAEHAFDAVPAGPSGQLARWTVERFLAWAMQ